MKILKVLGGEGTVYTDDVYLAYDEEDEHLNWLEEIDATKRGLVRSILVTKWLELAVASLWSKFMVWVNLVAEGLIVIGLLSYMMSQVLQLCANKASISVMKLI
ncbi:hypothetical protein Q8A73_015734 [Channa argus]|nr:hypothetical protein Q8A73_015734 [Channa argus]